MFPKRRILAAAALLASAIAFVPSAQAAANGPTDTVLVSANVPVSCVFTTTSDSVNFGTYDPIGANATLALTQPLTAHYICTQSDITYTFAFSDPNQTGGQCRMRRSSTSDYLNYNVKDTGSVAFLCNNAPASATGQPPGAGIGALSYIFTFTLPAGQNTVQTGTYTDTLTITIAG